jgi:hypothetical protein
MIQKTETNFDCYLDVQLADVEATQQLKQAGVSWVFNFSTTSSITLDNKL